MAIRLSRRKITSYIADQLAAGKDDTHLIQELAAFLIDNKRTKELDLVIRDIEYELKNRGIVLAHITSAFALTSATKTAITRMVKQQTGARAIELQQSVDPMVIGGVKIDIPGMRLDSTIANRLTTLRMNVKN